jgi:hypothetical protein
MPSFTTTCQTVCYLRLMVNHLLFISSIVSFFLGHTYNYCCVCVLLPKIARHQADFLLSSFASQNSFTVSELSPACTLSNNSKILGLLLRSLLYNIIKPTLLKSCIPLLYCFESYVDGLDI